MTPEDVRTLMVLVCGIAIGAVFVLIISWDARCACRELRIEVERDRTHLNAQMEVAHAWFDGQIEKENRQSL